LEIKTKYEIEDGSSWEIRKARLKIQGNWQEDLITCHYRPFDWRYCYFSKTIMDRPRKVIIDHIAKKDNLCLNIVRQTKAERWMHGLVSKHPTPAVFVEMKDGSSVFPLYRYVTTPFELKMGITRQPNISTGFLEGLEQHIGCIPIPEDIFHYIYAIFHSPTYCSRYDEFLKGDFPRVPMPRNIDLFKQLSGLGEKLVNLHLMKFSTPVQISSPFIKNGGSCIIDGEYPKYEGSSVIINKQKDGFVNVPETVWNFQVGGYQVCHKWLEDRRGRTLSQDDIGHYQKIVVALGQSIELMKQIDEAIPSWPIDAEYN
jgi:predicted helicase